MHSSRTWTQEETTGKNGLAYEIYTCREIGCLDGKTRYPFSNNSKKCMLLIISIRLQKTIINDMEK